MHSVILRSLNKSCTSSNKLLINSIFTTFCLHIWQHARFTTSFPIHCSASLLHSATLPLMIRVPFITWYSVCLTFLNCSKSNSLWRFRIFVKYHFASPVIPQHSSPLSHHTSPSSLVVPDAAPPNHSTIPLMLWLTCAKATHPLLPSLPVMLFCVHQHVSF